eukprot:46528_1
MCTFHNKLSSQSCEMCGTKNKSENNKKEKGNPAYWSCNMCTFHNKLSSQSCEMCGTKNKSENNKKEKEKRMSQLIDPNNKQMCVKGHSNWGDVREGCTCISCGSKKEIICCKDCWMYEYYNKGNKNVNPFHFTYCSDCRYNNGKNISNRIKLNNFKATIIREELL